jgi:hypothetical protein
VVNYVNIFFLWDFGLCLELVFGLELLANPGAAFPKANVNRQRGLKMGITHKTN